MPQKNFYIVAMSDTADGGIYRYQLDENGVPRKQSFTQVINANYMAFSPDGKYAYSTCTVGEDGGVAAFKVTKDGDLEPLNTCPAKGLSTCYITAGPTGKFIYCANYRSGSVSKFSINGDGSIKELTKQIQHEGAGVNLPRQEGPHTHFTGLTPDGKYLCVIDLGIDAVRLYALDDGKGIDTENPYTFSVEPAGSGPRHIVFNKKGDMAYLITELGNTVMSLKYHNGRFEHIQTISCVPEHLQCYTKASAIRLSPDERFLFASNRGFDSIAAFSVDQETGKMELSDMELSGGSSPRDINFLPDGVHFAAANEFSDIVVFYDYEPEEGLLRPNGQSVKHPRPLHIFREI